jgi:hypothetical protein
MKKLKKNGREDKITVCITFLFVLFILFLAGGIPKAQAAVVFFDTNAPFVLPGETISISIFSTEPTSGIRMDRISDDAMGGADNLYLNPGYDWMEVFNEGIAVNVDGVLIESVRGELETPSSLPVSGLLYSFNYTVSKEVMYGDIINIFADSSGGAINEVDVIGMIDNVTPKSLAVTVIPEPCSIFLLGLGVLFVEKTKHILQLNCFVSSKVHNKCERGRL